eukprot:345467-Rhodomonas_salina.1
MCGEFIGVPFDTDAFVFTITDICHNIKLEKLHRRVLKCLSLDTLSPRRVAKLRGKLLWHGTALDYAHVMTRGMSSFIRAPPTDEDWDIQRRRTPELYDSL